MNKIITTVGPSFLNKTKLSETKSEGLIYRINGAHGSINEIENYIIEIKNQIERPHILMDLPGNKVRTKGFDNGYILIKKGEEFVLKFENTNYYNFYKHLKPQDIIWANDSIFKFEVLSVTENNKTIKILSHSTGKLLNNKGMHVRGIHQDIPFLFDKDKLLIELANKHELDFVGLSFVRTRQDVIEAKKLIKSKSKIISKIETLSSVKNIDEIFKEVEYILVDRGDLSTEIGINRVPFYQKYIIDKGNFHDKKVFLATQFLKNMEINPLPTIPEVIDLYNTIKLGVYGIQLSEETAVGSYPIECIEFLREMMNECDKGLYSDDFLIK